jgi:dTDP-glucose pyrophosphorylase
MRSVDARASLTGDQQRAADAGYKAMMPIAGRPFLDFVLSAAADAGLERVAIVVAPDHEELERYYEVTSPPARVRVDFVVQSDARGTADAVLAAERWIDDDPFLVMNGDNLYPAKVIRDLATCDAPALPGFERTDLVRTGNIEAARVNAFALVEADEHGYLTRIVEKPEPGDASPHALVSMNCWRFDRRIFDACRDVPRSPRGEYELPLAVGLAIQNGVRFKVLPAQGPVLDLSQRADAAEVSRRLSGITPRP